MDHKTAESVPILMIESQYLAQRNQLFQYSLIALLATALWNVFADRVN